MTAFWCFHKQGPAEQPRSLGGTNADENLQTLCKPCNNAKGDLPYGRWLRAVSDKPPG